MWRRLNEFLRFAALVLICCIVRLTLSPLHIADCQNLGFAWQLCLTSKPFFPCASAGRPGSRRPHQTSSISQTLKDTTLRSLPFILTGKSNLVSRVSGTCYLGHHMSSVMCAIWNHMFPPRKADCSASCYTGTFLSIGTLGPLPRAPPAEGAARETHRLL